MFITKQNVSTPVADHRDEVEIENDMECGTWGKTWNLEGTKQITVLIPAGDVE